MSTEKYATIRAQMTIPQSMMCKCLRCGHEWVRRTVGQPKRCASCKSPYWNKAPGELPMGRPKKKG
jgi:predicted Zn-ribbon and HTH transcriptional regulator